MLTISINKLIGEKIVHLDFGLKYSEFNLHKNINLYIKYLIEDYISMKKKLEESRQI
jgi:hypothetical protein